MALFLITDFLFSILDFSTKGVNATGGQLHELLKCLGFDTEKCVLHIEAPGKPTKHRAVNSSSEVTSPDSLWGHVRQLFNKKTQTFNLDGINYLA